MRVVTVLSIVSILGLIPLATAGALEPQPTLEQIRRGKIRGFPQPEAEDVALIKEANRVFRVASRYEWPRISEVFPTPTLLIGDSHEYLMGHPAPPDLYYLVSRVDGFHMFAYGRDSLEPCPERSTARPVSLPTQRAVEGLSTPATLPGPTGALEADLPLPRGRPRGHHRLP